MTKEGSSLEKEFQFYLKNQSELIKQYNGKYIVIKDGKIIGAYDSEVEAVLKTSVNHELGTFLVQKCEPGKESYTQTYHSRVAFSNC
jgi:outer membrane lipoprotein-sorting protein